MLSWAELYQNVILPLSLLTAVLFFFKGIPHKENFVLRLLCVTIGCLAISYCLEYARLLGFFGSYSGEVRFFRWLIFCGISACTGWCYQCDCYQIEKAILCGCSVQYSAYSIYGITRILLGYVYKGIQYTTIKHSVLLLIVYFIWYMVMYCLFIRKQRGYLDSIRIRGVMPLALGILVASFVMDIQRGGMGILQNILFRVMAILVCMLILVVVLKVKENYRLEQEIATINQLSCMKRDYYESFKENLEVLNIKCHDYKHQISQFYKKLEDVSENEWLKELEESIQIYDTMIRTGNEDVDIVLMEKKMICDQEGICFTYTFAREKLGFIKKSDIYSLFGNLLDNAIEAVKQIDNPGKKQISLEIKRVGMLLYINLYNYYAVEPQWQNGNLMSTKEDKNQHGYGVKSIKMIVEKYCGEINISAEKGIFGVNVLLPIPNAE